MKKQRVFCLILIILLLLPACSSKKAEIEQSYEISDSAMGSTLLISLHGEVPREHYEAICSEAISRVKHIESVISRTDERSDLMRFNKSESGMEDADIVFQCVLSAALYACELTDGAFDPTLGTLTDLWRTRQGNSPPSDRQIDNALVHVGQSRVFISGPTIAKVDPQLLLDLDGVGRGYALDKAICCLSNSFADYGSCSFSDSAGFFGTPPDGVFTVEEKDHNGRSLARLSIDGGFISRSVRGAANGALVLDPVTGTTFSGDLKCVIVLSECGAMSDALSTALLVSGSARAIDLWRKSRFSFDAILVTDDTVYVTGRFATDGAFELLNNEYKLKKITEK